jgi:hypothetical protein
MALPRELKKDMVRATGERWWARGVAAKASEGLGENWKNGRPLPPLFPVPPLDTSLLRTCSPGRRRVADRS